MILFLEIVLLVLCLFASWFFSGIETGIISINRLRLRHMVRRKVPGSDILQSFLQKPDSLFGTTLVGTNIAHTIAAVIAASLGLHWMGAEGTWITSAAITVIILVFCEYFPKAWFQSFPARRCLPFARLLNVLRLILMPIGKPLMMLVKIMIPIRDSSLENQPFITRDEIIHLAGEGKASGFLTPEEHRMIHEVMQLKTKPCREIMTPRDRIVYIAHDAPVRELLELARVKEVDRVPVFDREKNAFVGIINVADILMEDGMEKRKISEFMRPPQFVADYTPVDHVLPRMRVTRQPMVLVTDERFEVIGLVALEDVLEEIVGTP